MAQNMRHQPSRNKIYNLIQQNQVNMDRAVAASQTGTQDIKSGILMVLHARCISI